MQRHYRDTTVDLTLTARGRDSLSAERVRELVDYDPATGVMKRRVRAANAMPGTVIRPNHSNGYARLRLDGNLYFAHRVAWVYVYGEWPQGQIDHINGCCDDNRIANLRIANGQMEQQQNTKLRSDNSSGYKGVFFDTRAGKWQAVIHAYGKRHGLGFFDNRREAARAYAKAKKHLHTFSPTVRT